MYTERDGNSKEDSKEIKNTVTEINNAFDAFINTLDMAKEGISELEEMSIETSKTEMQREKRMKETKHNIQEQGGTITKGVTHA